MNRRRADMVRRADSIRGVVLVACVAATLGGCASPGAGTSQAPLPVDPTGSPHATLRIAQQRVSGEPLFLLVAQELPPTRKTLALAITVSSAAVPPRVIPDLALIGERRPSPVPPRTALLRVRKPVGSIYFASAGSRVGPAASPAVAAAVASAARANRLVLTAFGDPHGTLEVNHRLAERRAGSVAAALEARGVDPGQLIVLSRPQCCAREPLPEREAAPYRRVDIEILTRRTVLSEERGDDPQHES